MKKLGYLLVAALSVLSLQFAVLSPSANAAWVNKKAFDQYTLNLKCNQIAYIYGWAGNKGAQNFGGTVSDWYCVYTSSQKVWLKPGDVCKYRYGQSYKFATTNFYYKFGGYCAVWA